MFNISAFDNENQKWLSAFSEWLKGQGLSPETIDAYLQDCVAFLRYYYEENQDAVDIPTLTGADFRGFREWSIRKGTAPATWNRRRATLSKLVVWAQETGKISYERNPLAGVESFEEQERPPRWLEEAEFRRLMRAIEQQVYLAQTEAAKCQALRDQAMVALMIYAGLREGEVCALNRADIEISDRKGKVTVRRGKGDKKREVPLASEVRRALSEFSEARCPSTVLFAGKGGERITTSGIQKRVRDLGELAKLEGLSPHDLRHTFAKRLLDSGSPLTVVQKLLGHARLETTARYVQPGWKDFENSIEKL